VATAAAASSLLQRGEVGSKEKGRVYRALMNALLILCRILHTMLPTRYSISSAKNVLLVKEKRGRQTPRKQN
jgi:hypothetical protein